MKTTREMDPPDDTAKFVERIGGCADVIITMFATTGVLLTLMLISWLIFLVIT